MEGQAPGDGSWSQSRYYDRYQQASGEAIAAPTKQTPDGGGGRGLLVVIIACVVAAAVVATVVILKVTGGSDGQPVDAAQTSAPAKSTPSASTTPQLSWTNPAASAAPTGAGPL